MSVIVRPSTLALAFLSAAEKELVNAVNAGVKNAPDSAKVNWVARRVYHAPDHAGMVKEQSFNAHLSKRTYNVLHNQGVI